MLLGKYHIVIFKDGGKGGSRNLRMRGWLGAFLFLGAVALISCNVWLWGYYTQSFALVGKLTEAEKTVEEQSGRLLNFANKLTEIASDLDRVQQFDAKLRIMMNMEKDPADVGAHGGPRIESFSVNYLPLHRQELATRKMQAFLKQLQEDVQLEEVRQQDLLRSLRTNRDNLLALPSIWPVVGFVSSGFGGRSSPFGSRGEFHRGLDINNRMGTPVIATARGTISFANVDGAYGNSVEIDHGNGVITKYAHMQRFVVRQGQWVRRGEVIGYVGMSGRTTGPHLHYEVRLNGVPVNPMRYILN